MSARINELAKSLGLTPTIMLDDSSREVECYLDAHGSVPSTALMHKFAMLIVQECAQLCEPEQGIKYSPNSSSARADCRLRIKKHFGVA